MDKTSTDIHWELGKIVWSREEATGPNALDEKVWPSTEARP
jgi:hypothetical protein